MPYIPPDVVAKAKEMDLLTYLQNYEPQELVRLSSNTYCTHEHDSLKISNGKWCWYSRGIGGRSALDYLIKVKEIPFTEAVEIITGQVAIRPPVFAPTPKEEKPKVLLLPPACRSTTNVVNYLQRRGIDEELICFCLSTGRLYESISHHNAVFVGMDKENNPRYACLRGIGTDFLGDVNGSDKRYSFHIPAKDDCTTVHLFESAIDLLSYAALLKLYGREWNREHLLSLSGVYRPKKEISESSIPLALTQYLSDHPQIRRIILRLDNDYTGRIAAKTLITLLSEKYVVAYKPPPKGKDYNDYLCMLKHIPITKRKEKER